ncbi:hypothetical protein [Chachezhania sediminis]|nr:hypothetical protein [Chachezhania sediminis]
MTNQLALALGLLIVAALIGDISVYGDEHIVFLGKKLYALIDWLAFWR